MAKPKEDPWNRKVKADIGYRHDPRNRDLTGQRFGRLIIMTRAPSRGYRTYWNVRCDCGTEKEVSQSVLVTGKAKSCGCFNAENRAVINTKHGKVNTPTYISWCSMWARCTNSKLKSYANYGGRGVSVCEEWKDFSVFLSDMGERPNGTSIDRINVNGNYEPSNCRWATPSEQRRNQRAAAEIGRSMP